MDTTVADWGEDACMGFLQVNTPSTPIATIQTALHELAASMRTACWHSGTSLHQASVTLPQPHTLAAEFREVHSPMPGQQEEEDDDAEVNTSARVSSWEPNAVCPLGSAVLLTADQGNLNCQLLSASPPPHTPPQPHPSCLRSKRPSIRVALGLPNRMPATLGQIANM